MKGISWVSKEEVKHKYADNGRGQTINTVCCNNSRNQHAQYINNNNICFTKTK